MAPAVNARGPLFVHPSGIVKRTTFHVLAMYANLLEANVAESWIASDTIDAGGGKVPVVDAIATRDDSMRDWRIACINRDPSTPKEVTLAIDGRMTGRPRRSSAARKSVTAGPTS